MSAQRGSSRGRRGHFGLVPNVQSIVARIVHVHNGKCLRRHPHEQERSASKRGYVHFTGPQKKGAMAFVECWGRMLFDTMEASIGMRPLGGLQALMTDGIRSGGPTPRWAAAGGRLDRTRFRARSRGGMC